MYGLMVYYVLSLLTIGIKIQLDLILVKQDIHNVHLVYVYKLLILII